MPRLPEGKVPRLTRRQIESCLRIGSLEWAANKEYWSNRYHPEKGGPALAALNEARKEHAKLFKKGKR
jgi:hypothetical protein